MGFPGNQTGRMSPQTLLHQRYLIVGHAGQGGMGAVYLALDTQAGQRMVAVKEMSQGHLSGPKRAEAEARFNQEAALLHSLVHPNLPRFHDAFTENGRSYLVMDFIQGKALQRLLTEAGGRPLPVEQVLRYARNLCDVLNYLHHHQPPIIFRDLKPANVMITDQDQSVLIDLGIARFFKEGQKQDTVLLGSPGYAPPEQHGLSQTDPRSDFYSLGATLNHCLTGADPSFAQNRFIFQPARQINPQVPPELDALIQRLVALDPSKRPSSAAEILQVLAQIGQESSAPTEWIAPLPATQYVPPRAFAASSPTLSVAEPPPLPGGPPPLPASSPRLPVGPPPLVRPAAALGQAPAGQAPFAPPAPPAAWPPATSRPAPPTIWSRGFTLLFGLLLLVLAGGSWLIFSVVTASDHGVEATLALVLTLLSFIACVVVKKSLPGFLLCLTGLLALVPASTFLVQAVFPDLRRFVTTYLPQSTIDAAPVLNQVLTVGLVALCLLSLLWLLRPFSWADRLALLIVFGLALACALLQARFDDFSDAKHVLLVVTLIGLNQGVLLASAMERLSRKRQNTSWRQNTP
jgi:serine/threonine protein kinase